MRELLQLPYVAATCKQPLPTPSAALFSVSAMYSVGFLPAFSAALVRSARVSSRREVLFRRHASNISSLGEAPYASVSGCFQESASGSLPPRLPYCKLERRNSVRGDLSERQRAADGVVPAFPRVNEVGLRVGEAGGIARSESGHRDRLRATAKTKKQRSGVSEACGGGECTAQCETVDIASQRVRVGREPVDAGSVAEAVVPHLPRSDLAPSSEYIV